MKYDQLTPTQLNAVKTTNKAVRIIAGAGSGKTRVLTTRISYLIDELNIDAKNILAITFTNKAAKEMKERIEKMNPLAVSATISTIHSLCARILRNDINVLGYPSNYTVCDSEDQKSILKQAYKYFDTTKNVIGYSSMLAYISNNKTEGVSPEKALEFLYGNSDRVEVLKVKIYQYYQDYLAKNYLLDFDDLIIKTVEIFDNYPDILFKYAKKYQHILVDEFQDVDHLQYKLIKQLSSYHKNIYVVGDPDQTIYTWRGSDVSIILDFKKHFEDVETIVLNENFRSCSNILNAANSVIKNNRNRIEKDLYTNNPIGDKVVYLSFTQDDYEADFVAQKIEAFKNNGLNYNDIAILYRANHQSRSLEKGLIEHRIPYIIYGGIRFYERAEIKDILSYLRMLTSADDLAFLRTINTPKRGIGNKAIEELNTLALKYSSSLFETCCNNLETLKNKGIKSYVETILTLKSFMGDIDLQELLERVLDLTGYRLMLSASNEEERLDNIKELIKDIIDYQQNYPDSNLEEYLQMVSLYTDRENINDTDLVKLMTIHSAKGLEFDNVFIIGMNEGIFPSERSLNEGIKGLEEERRLAYVAYTRAKKRLFLTETSGFNYITGKEKVVSRFINEINQDFIENPKAKKETINTNILESKDKGTANILFKKGDSVFHRIFKDGIVISNDSGILTIAFKFPHGTKKIKADHPSITKGKN